ncbi:ABC transporter ATP-binding protein [Albibacterium indicum]|uniref:ABC transporter ATP-binding protein n=1 Tax=Albibacterium indicum TaxID=2292082 RepID=UPI000E52A321|nr:ABC transporter ATP-binding protein [Pedobacter indicus]
MLSAKGIYKSYGKLQILKGVSLEVNTGEIVGIVGASGAGKSTLLHIIGSLASPDSGSVEINGTELSKLSTKKLSDFRNKNIGFIFQFHHLLPEFTALENVCMPAFIAKRSKKDSESRARELLKLLNLSHRTDHKPAELSGGEQQRVAVARALINNPAVVLADEPSGNLDSDNARALNQIFVELRDKLNQTFVIVTHNEELAGISDRIVHMKDGEIVDNI